LCSENSQLFVQITDDPLLFLHSFFRNVTGPASIEFFARVAAQAGEADRAISALQKLLSTSYSGPLGPGAPLTPALLRLDPMFDRLRNDSRFQELLASQLPKQNQP